VYAFFAGEGAPNTHNARCVVVVLVHEKRAIEVLCRGKNRLTTIGVDVEKSCASGFV